MIVDTHGHLSLPDSLHIWRSYLFAHRGSHGRYEPKVQVSDDQMIATVSGSIPHFQGKSHLGHLRETKTDFQLISPRPFMSMHSEKPGRIVHWYTEEINNMIAQQCRLFPNLFAGVCGLPFVWGDPIKNVLPELERCVKQFGMLGCLINPDPSEGLDTANMPPLSHEYWYPLWEKLCELDVVGYIHSAACKAQRVDHILGFVLEESIAVINLVGWESRVFQDFPKLKIVVSHGGGAIPYQLGRFESIADRRAPEPFIDSLRRLWFDTCLYSPDGLECLLKVVGPDRCMFGTENPGVGTMVNKKTGRRYDDVAPVIDSFDFLTAADKKKVFETNAVDVFKLKLPAKSWLDS